MNSSQRLICPYPGLRPFTEEEAIFFKGRDTHVRQIIQQLEERKIVVITGASGDGKSSIVYAGVIPNARAGFFRAPHTNWLICDFRPERAPLDNLSAALAQNLELDFETTRNELSFGFSSLVDLFRNSPFYNQKTTDSNANLLILADQFEEFFTNSENYAQGKASENAYTTVNLLLETAQIALDENLPIYVVFTMRSDFISQSVAFKGLPETIGFSQFFVPRLKRHELQKVIEDPAKLAGGKITPRLAQVLINELPEGFDQLPLLQHALNRLWKNADNGNQEIDFLHLAQIGGFDPKMLDAQSTLQFEQFYNQLDAYQQDFYRKPGFSNILNMHANQLYANTVNYIEQQDWIWPKPNHEQIETTLQTAFKSLTKIDQGRAVRNRAELIEIKRIINRTDINYELVCAAINSYRMPDSTFVRPFMNPNVLESIILPPDTVLDITHEALIRNWETLFSWGQEEQHYLDDYQDLMVQVNRWLDNDRDKAFLLSRGALAYFQEWHDKARPNPYWIAKNESWVLEYEPKLEKATLVFSRINQFLKASHNHLMAIEKARKRRRTILFAAAIVGILILSGFLYWALQEKNYAVEQEQLANIEKEKAYQAQEIAEKQKIIADENEKQALAAKTLSDSARLEANRAREAAEQQRLIAEQQRAIAIEKSQLAENEADRATKQSKIADQQRKIAEKQEELALAASDSAKKLSYLALAQSLAYKAKTSFEDKQLNVLTAYQAYLFNKNYGGYPYDNTIFEGLRYVSDLLNISDSYSLDNENKVVAIELDNSGQMQIFFNDGNLFNVDPNSGESTQKQIVSGSSVSLNAAFLLNDTYMVLSHNDYSNELVNLKSDKSYKIKYHDNYLRAAVIIADKKLLLTGGRDSKLVLSEIDNNKLNIIQEKEMNSRIRTMDLHPKVAKAYVGLQNGELYSYDINNQNISKIIQWPDARINTIKIVADKNFVAIGLSNGHLIIMDVNTGKTINDLFVSYAEIKHIAVDQAQDRLALVLADNSILLYQTTFPDEKPIEIADMQQRIESILLNNSNKMNALNARNEVKSYFVAPDAYAKQLEKQLKRNFTRGEWEQIVGKEVPYEETF